MDLAVEQLEENSETTHRVLRKYKHMKKALNLEPARSAVTLFEEQREER